jgi:anti-sigma B factor antagonist
MPEPRGPILESIHDLGVLVLAVIRKSIEGDEVADALRQELLGQVERSGARKVAVDLSQVRYLSSIAFWPLLSLRRRLTDQGGRLIICGLTATVADVFETTKMISSSGAADAPFEVAADRAEAVGRLAGPAKGP